MKVLRPNDIAIESLNEDELTRFTTNPEKAVEELIKINPEHVQYVKAERTDGTLLRCEMHPFVQAVHMAYGSHLPLVISPDMIWYLISSAVAMHINENAEQLRNKFVNHEGKQTIQVRRDDFSLGSKSNPWHEVIDEFCIKIGEKTNNNVADIMQANFSTTTKDARVVSQIVLMDAMQKYFEFKFSTMCGIPEIRIKGDKNDWLNVKDKTEKIIQLIPELNKWYENGLNEILNQFINALDGNEDNQFWNEIYKVSGGSGGPFLSGWLVALFPYLNDGERVYKNRYVWESTWRDSLAAEMFGGLTTNSFDYHMNKVPFTWEYYSQEIKMLFVGGLIGVLYEKDKSVAPIFGYAVTEDKLNSGSSPNFAE